ncbi:aldo/keto reductase [Nonomuraea sp. NBC_00507]|uniref:aldo/keto reductase n=1 Tax=Nonomuraea sp. NBC_00507 TaxID=2976002 RepID=UPI002E175F01
MALRVERGALLGRWRRSRGVGDEVVIATKLGRQPNIPTTALTHDLEGLSAQVIRESSERSRERLGVDKLDLLYAHAYIEGPRVPPEETVHDAFDPPGRAE